MAMEIEAMGALGLGVPILLQQPEVRRPTPTTTIDVTQSVDP